ncbi:unnamed protein product [Chrysodeixis includens]|uniref:Uncharacterized protein n=1 Tax=Chrysodeixis includens TaxID=689277 RepID=A0A9P0FUW3_CHRIL|nr:unnamed protein product [Chrysodeixis includens]
MLATMLRDETYDKHVKELLDFINSLYRQDAKDKFSKVLVALEQFNKQKDKSVSDLVKIVREGVRSIIFDHYTELNPNARRELKAKIETFLKQYKQQPSTTLSKKQATTTTKVNFKAEKNPDDYKDDKSESKKREPNSLKVEKKEERETEIKSGKEDGLQEDRRKKDDDSDEDYNMNKNENDIGSDRSGDSGPFKYYDTKIEAPEYDEKNEEGNMREGKESLEDRGWVPKPTKTDSRATDSGEDLTQNQVPRSYQKTTKKHSSNNGRTFSSDEKISEDVGTVEGNSEEFKAEEQATTTQRSIANEQPRFITLWEETATGGIPGYMLKQMTSKKHKTHKTHKTTTKTHKPHKSKTHKHHEKSEKSEKSEKEKKKKRGHKDKVKEEYRPNLSRSKKNFEQKADVEVIRSTAMDFYEYKKNFGPVNKKSSNSHSEGHSPRAAIQSLRAEHPIKLSMKFPIKAAFRTTLGAKKTTKRTQPATPKYAKRYQLKSLYLTSPKDYRKSGATPKGSREENSYEHFRKKEKNSGRNLNESSSDVIIRINNLERQIEEFKNKMGTSKSYSDKENQYDVKETKDFGRGNDRKRFKILRNTSGEDKSKSNVSDKTADYNLKPYGYNDNTSVSSTVKPNTRETKDSEVSYKVAQNKIDRSDKKLGNEDIRREDGTVSLNSDTNILQSEEEIDVWKDAINLNAKNVPTKLTSKSSTITTKSTTVSNTTTPKSTTVSIFDIFIPVSSPTKTTIKTTFRTTTKSEENREPSKELSFHNTPKGLTALKDASPFAASNFMNYSTGEVAQESVQNEVSFLLKKNNISVPTSKPDDTSYTKFSLPFKRARKELAFTAGDNQFDFNYIANKTIDKAEIAFPDPFRNADEELEIFKYEPMDY